MRKTSTDMTHPSEQQAAPLYCPPCIPEREERTAYIDLDAIEHNVRRLKELIGPRVLIAIVKADAYGHGAYPVARSARRRRHARSRARQRGPGVACRRY